MFKVLTEGCEPTRGTKHSACVDLYASEDVVIGAGETSMVGLGVCIDEEHYKHISKLYETVVDIEYESLDVVFSEHLRDKFKSEHYLALHPRSSLRAKGLISNTGIIDLDYQDEIKIIIHNPIAKVHNYYQDNTIDFSCVNGDKYVIINKGDRIAQIMLCEHKSYMLGIETEDERNGGFGSTDK